jgi:hypothetical protein
MKDNKPIEVNKPLAGEEPDIFPSTGFSIEKLE